MKRAIRLTTGCLGLILFGCMSLIVRAQDAPTAARPDRGTMPNGTYSVSDIENINLQNGNVNLSIPLASLPPIAGGKLSWSLSAQYNSKIWNIVRVEADAYGDLQFRPYVIDVPQVNETPWRIGGMYELDVRSANEDYDYMTEDIPPPALWPGQDYQLRINHNWYKVIFTTPDGAEHELRPLDYQPYPDGSSLQTFLYGYYDLDPYAQSSPVRYYSFDGSFIYAEVSMAGWKVYMPDGIVIEMANGLQRIKDTNGNSIKIYTESNETGTIQTTHYQDEQTGREIKYVLDRTNSLEWQGKVWYQTVTGVWQHIDINFGTTTVEGKIYRVKDWQTGSPVPCYHEQVLGTKTIMVVREIVLPQTEPNVTRKYTFGYNSDTKESVTTNHVSWNCGGQAQPYIRDTSKGWGALNQIVTPSGAEIKYTYSQDPFHALFFADSLAGESITKKELIHDYDTTGALVTDIWEYSIGGGTVKNPDGSIWTENKYPQSAAFGYGYGVAGLVYRSTGPFKKVERHWINLTFDGAYTNSPGGQVSFNPVVDAEYTTLLDAQNNELKMSARTFQYDYNGNLLETKEYDWFDHTLVSRDGNGVPTGVPQGAVLLQTVSNSYYNGAGSAGSGNVYAKRALGTATPRILNAPQEMTASLAITRFSYDQQSYGTAPTLGNLTKVSSFDNQGDENAGNDRWLDATTAYDSYGNKTSVTDANGRVTYFEYDNAAYGQPNRVKVNPLNGTGVQTTSAEYDPSTGLVTSQTDVNNQVSTISYFNQRLNAIDPYGRPGVVTGPLVTVNGVTQSRKVVTTYEDSLSNPVRLGRVIVTADLNSEGDGLLKSRMTQDQLGRTILTEQSEDGTNFTISSQTVYEQMGKIIYQSNPRRGTGSASTDGWTRSTRDEIGRVIEVATFSGIARPASNTACETAIGCTGLVTSSYYGQETTVTDQAGKARKSVVDALGRLVKVIEDPQSVNPQGLNYETSYTYDVLGNLTKVTQGTQTPRVFVYSNVSRLASAANPESGTISYLYDNNGNLTSRTDARGVVTSYGYDGLSRVTSRTYSDGTPAVTNTYDTLTNGKGRLTSVSSSVSTTSYTGYDSLGRVLGSIQETAGYPPFEMLEYRYDLAGNLTSQKYPSGRVVSTSYDNSGRISSVTGQKTGEPNKTYASSYSYTAHGAVGSVKLGNDLWEHTSFNGRLQPIEIGLGTSSTDSGTMKLGFSYGVRVNNVLDATKNNGNLESQTIIGAGLNLTQSYTYDQLNRLKTFTESVNSSQATNLTQTYDYDRWGNRAITAGYRQSQTITPSPQLLTDFNPNNNRIVNASYDYAGNLTSAVQGHLFYYDAENKMTAHDDTSTVGTLDNQYSYDGDGQRVKKVTGTVTTIFVYNAMGQMVAEYTDDSNPSPTSGTSYFTADHLGTPRVITNQQQGVISRHDYLPFGEEIKAQAGGRTTGQGYIDDGDGIRQKFTQKERDTETGLDYFGARYYSSTLGRFTSIDPANESIKLENPQSLNRYSYSLNNPLRYVDPDGRIPVETAIDVVSLAHSFYDLVRNPSFTTAAFFVWDAAATLLPYVPGSYVGRGIRLARETVEWTAKVGAEGYMGLRAAGILRKLDDFETAINNKFIREGVALLGQGDDSVRSVLGMSRAEKAADFLGVTQSGTFKIAETKGSDLVSAVTQLSNTANRLLEKVGNVKFTAEVILRKDQKLPGNFKVIGNQLHRFDPGVFNEKTGQWGAWILQKAGDKPITVRRVG